MRNKDKFANVDPLPPKLPANERELDRTIVLLGNRKQSDLNPRCKQELEQLIGAYPTMKEAALWKRLLRRACRDAEETQGARATG